MLELRAPCKLNLGLRLLAKRADGYHEIETIFVPLRLFDRLWLEARPGAGLSLQVTGADLDAGPRNLVVRAAAAACEALGRPPDLAIRLEKQIPIAAGLGGGSADAALTLLGVEELLGVSLGPARERIALGLGADVPFFLDPRPALGAGVGEVLTTLEDFPEMWWVLVALPFEVSTAEAYRLASAELTQKAQGSSIAALLGASGWTLSPPNDLETVVSRRHPAIGEARRALEMAGAIFTGMSGSGPTVFGRFPDHRAAEAAARGVNGPDGCETMVVSSPGSGDRDWGWGVAKW